MSKRELDLRSMIDLLRRQAKVIGMTLAVVLGLALLMGTMLPPAYRATALVQLDPTRGHLLAPNPRALTALDVALIDSAVELMRTEPVLVRTARIAGLVGEPEFMRPPAWAPLMRGDLTSSQPKETEAGGIPGQLIDRLRQSVAVERRGNSLLVAITAKAGSPELAARLANGLGKAYLQEQLAAKVESALSARDILAEQVEGLRHKLAESEEALSSFFDEQADAGPNGIAQREDLAPEQVIALYERQHVAEVAREQYQSLLARMKDVESQVYLQVPDARVVAAALPPEEAFFPNFTLIFTLAGIAAAGIGLGLAFLNDRFVAGFVSAEQMQSALGLRFAATVPLEKSAARVSSPELRDAQVSSHTGFAEAIGQIKLGVDHMLHYKTGDKGAVIVVTSAEPGEGKTTLALALARAYAQAGHEALLLDCDFRRPSVHKAIGAEPALGLLDYLTGGAEIAELDQLLLEEAGAGLKILPCAYHASAPTEHVIEGPRFKRLIESARSGFDIVIIDAPPVLAVTDALRLAALADLTAFVVRWAATSAPEARRALGLLATARAGNGEIIGILNQENGRQSTRSRKYAAYYAQA